MPLSDDQLVRQMWAAFSAGQSRGKLHRMRAALAIARPRVLEEARRWEAEGLCRHCGKDELCWEGLCLECAERHVGRTYKDRARDQAIARIRALAVEPGRTRRGAAPAANEGKPASYLPATAPPPCETPAAPTAQEPGPTGAQRLRALLTGKPIPGQPRDCNCAFDMVPLRGPDPGCDACHGTGHIQPCPCSSCACEACEGKWWDTDGKGRKCKRCRGRCEMPAPTAQDTSGDVCDSCGQATVFMGKCREPECRQPPAPAEVVTCGTCGGLREVCVCCRENPDECGCMEPETEPCPKCQPSDSEGEGKP